MTAGQKIVVGRTGSGRWHRTVVFRLVAALAIAGSILIMAATALASGATSVETIDTNGTNGKSSAVRLDDAGNPIVLYTADNQVRLASCADPNCSFPVLETIFTDFEGRVDIENLGFDSRGYPFFTYFVEFGNDTGRRLVRCNDSRCGSFSKELIRVNPVITLSADDRAIFSYGNSNGRVKLAQCSDIACSSTNGITIIDIGRRPALTLDGNGYPAIFYQGQLGDSKVARCTDISCSTPAIQAISARGVFRPSILIDHNDHPVISFENADGLNLVLCDDPLCETSTTRVVDSAKVSASLALDEAGHPVLAYRRSGSIRLARCQDQDCATVTVEIVDESSGRPPSLLLDRDGYPIVTYNDSSSDGLKLAHCGNPSCLEFVRELPAVGTYYLRSVETGRYLDADIDGGVATSHVARRDDRWHLDIAIPRTSLPFTLTNGEFATSIERTNWIPEDAGDGTFYLRRISDATRNYLSTSGTGVVMTVRDQSDRWTFVPVDEAEPTDLVGQQIALQNLVTSRWLDFDSDGSVGQSVNLTADDVWLIEDAGDDFVYLRSAVSGHYLEALDDFTITTRTDTNSKSKWEAVAVDGIATFRNTRFGGFLGTHGPDDDDVIRIRTRDFSAAAQWQFVVTPE